MKYRLISKNGFLGVLSLVCMVLFLIGCYNPFEDYSNVSAIIDTDIKDSDTLEIFDTRTFTIELAVKELVSTFTFECSANRFYTDSTVQIAGRDTVLYPLEFKCSFFDTGYHLIRFRLKKLNGEETIQDYRVFAVSALYQDSVFGCLGDSLRIQAVRVKDRDVFYHWNFGDGIILKSLSAQVQKPLYGDLVGHDKGEFWVSDLSERCKSPIVKFYFNLNDVSGPKISCMGCNEDTAVSAGAFFRFVVDIFDDGTTNQLDASVNGISLKRKNSSLYYADINFTDTLKKPLPLRVSAIDKYRNTTIDTFWLKYDPSLLLKEKSILEVKVPSNNQTYITDTISVYGTFVCQSNVLNHTIEIMVNDTFKDSYSPRGSFSTDWGFQVSLKENDNIITVVAKDSAGVVVASEKRLVVFSANFQQKDTIIPRIVYISANNTEIMRTGWNIIDSINALLSIVAFDENKIKSVNVNANAAHFVKGYAWECSVSVSHYGDKIPVVITDGTGNICMDTIRLKQNYIPQITPGLKAIKNLLVGDTLRDSIKAEDKNGRIVDTLIFKCRTPGVVIDSLSGDFFWVPELKDTAIKSLVFEVTDGIDFSLPYYLDVCVHRDSSTVSPPLHFITSGWNIPEVIIAGRDTLKVPLKTNSDSVSFSVQKLTGMINLPAISDLYLIWVPASADTGQQWFKVSASDKMTKDSTSVNLFITVMPESYDFKTQSNWDGPIKEDRSLDLSSTENRFPLTVKIHPVSEDNDFFVQYTLLGKTYQDSLDHSNWQIVLDPAAKSFGRDSIVVVITKKTAVSRKIVKILDYGSPPEKPVFNLPVNNTVCVNDSCTLKWTGNDADNNPLSYRIYLSVNDGSFEEIAATRNTSFTYNKMFTAGKYHFKIVAFDGKSSIESAIRTITVDPPDRVRFKTTQGEIPIFIQCGTAWTYPLEITGGYPPFTFSVSSDAAVTPFFSPYNTINWVPEQSDTGLKKITLIVTDSFGNRDILTGQVWIVSKHYAPVLTCNSKRMASEGYLDLHTVSVPDTLDFSIADSDPFEIETYQIHTKILNVSGNYSIGMKRTFQIIVDPRLAEVSADTIAVVLTDRWGLEDTCNIAVFYGSAPMIPEYLYPQTDATISSDLVTLSWNCIDPDADQLLYTIYRGTSQNQLAKVQTTNEKSVQFSNLAAGKYYWKIEASDGLHVAVGPVWNFLLSR